MWKFVSKRQIIKWKENKALNPGAVPFHPQYVPLEQPRIQEISQTEERVYVFVSSRLESFLYGHN